MSIANKYQIEQRFISFGDARSGEKLIGPLFIVSHETANNTADADDHFKYFNGQQPSASAHTFIDDTKILEIIPLNEKAWHNRYDNPEDNKLFGEDANDASIGVELCRTGEFKESYDRYVWYHAYLCRTFELDIFKRIVAHKTLDPRRRSDPESWLKPNGVSWSKFINDVKAYYDAWDEEETVIKVEAPKTQVKPIIVSNPERALHKGDKGTPVTNLQKKLIAAGFKLPKYGSDGDYGNETVSAVKKFQRAVAITVDGIAGPVTFSKLDTYKKPSNNRKAIVPYPGHLIKKGSRGKDVKRIQRALGITVDGIFGAKTEAAVKAYQKRHGLKVDGFVGNNTWNKMF